MSISGSGLDGRPSVAVAGARDGDAGAADSKECRSRGGGRAGSRNAGAVEVQRCERLTTTRRGQGDGNVRCEVVRAGTGTVDGRLTARAVLVLAQRAATNDTQVGAPG